ncbi:hypothetical protein GCM10027214_35040 [Stenotrophomonas tumulicola]
MDLSKVRRMAWRKNELVERGPAPLPFARRRKQEQRGMDPLYPSPSPHSAGHGPALPDAAWTCRRWGGWGMRKNELVERGHAPLPFAQCRKQEQRGMAPLYPSPITPFRRAWPGAT